MAHLTERAAQCGKPRHGDDRIGEGRNDRFAVIGHLQRQALGAVRFYYNTVSKLRKLFQ